MVSHHRAFLDDLRPHRVLLMPNEVFAHFEVGHLDRVEVFWTHVLHLQGESTFQRAPE